MKGKKVTPRGDVRANSVSACWAKCENRQPCNFIAWNKRSRYCIMFKTYTGGRRKTGYYSGPVVMPSTPKPGIIWGICSTIEGHLLILLETTTCGQPVLRKNWFLKGTKVKNHKLMQTKTASICWDKCKKNPECNFIVWRKRFKTCTRLASHRSGMERKAFISGPLSNCE